MAGAGRRRVHPTYLPHASHAPTVSRASARFSRSTPVDTARTKTESLSIAELRRYGRHLSLTEVGEEGQLRLKAGRVLLVGAGGLGPPLALYLAVTRVGPIRGDDFR